MLYSPQKTPEVAIVLCTHNGSQWIEEQIESIFAQTHPVAIRVFDDASSDDTVAMIQSKAAGHDVKCIIRDEALGVVNNFSNGIQRVLDEGFAYIALSDQDDIWSPDRIKTGLDVLKNAESSSSNKPHPCLAHSDLALVDAHNQIIHASFMKWRGYKTNATKDLATILGQNGVMGNTILMNRAMAEVALPFPNDLHVHDYWIALVAELLGERLYVNKPLVRYRIHGKNVSNSADTVVFESRRWVQKLSIKYLSRRDFVLPFKEDSRQNSLRFLLKDDRFTSLSANDRATISAFLTYLNFQESRLSIAVTVLKNRFLRPGIRHRLKVIGSILTSRRYENVNSRNH